MAAVVAAVAASVALHGANRCGGREVSAALPADILWARLQTSSRLCLYAPLTPMFRAWLMFGAIQCAALLIERTLEHRPLPGLARIHPHLQAALIQCVTMSTLLVQVRRWEWVCSTEMAGAARY